MLSRRRDQVDFRVSAPVVTSEGKRKKTHVFRIVLSHSRKAYSEACFWQTAKDFLRVLENAFRHFGGAPPTVVVDTSAAPSNVAAKRMSRAVRLVTLVAILIPFLGVVATHSPQHGGEGILGLLRGFWHAHIGWFFRKERPDDGAYIADLRASRTLRIASFLSPVWVVLGLLIPAVLGGVITRTWGGIWTGLIWGGLIRLFLVHHVTWSVNSACHLWGLHPYKSKDESRNNALFGILAMGEGWHNTHHAFPTSARHGLRWWQIDMSYWVIRSLAWIGLAWNLKLPSKEAQERALIRPTREPGL